MSSRSKHADNIREAVNAVLLVEVCALQSSSHGPVEPRPRPRGPASLGAPTASRDPIRRGNESPRSSNNGTNCTAGEGEARTLPTSSVARAGPGRGMCAAILNLKKASCFFVFFSPENVVSLIISSPRKSSVENGSCSFRDDCRLALQRVYRLEL